LDGLAALSGEGIDVMVLVDGVDFNWGGVKARTLTTEKGFKEALELVFPRLFALEMKGYKTSLVVDAKYRICQGRERLLMAQNFEYVFTAANATFPLGGYRKKLREVRHLDCQAGYCY
jgi:hypothetical protein